MLEVTKHPSKDGQERYR